MSNLQAVTRKVHANLRWQAPDNFSFASKVSCPVLSLAELSRACMTYPLAFKWDEGCFKLVGLLGLEEGKNLFVAPDGRWIGPYIPAMFRGYPFALVENNHEQTVLCVDIASGLVGEGHNEPFFDQQGEISPKVKGVLAFLENVKENLFLTQNLCNALDREGLIEPWPITQKVSDVNEVGLVGFYRINETSFNGLGVESLHSLHKAGALPLAFCQLLSMQHLPLLSKLAGVHAKSKALLHSTAFNMPPSFQQLLQSTDISNEDLINKESSVKNYKDGGLNWNL